MSGYYAARLSGERLRRCYEVAPPRVRQYLEAEIEHVVGRLRPGDRVLELGCGYGRVTLRLAEVTRGAVGIDTAPESLRLAARLAGPSSGCCFARMDALALGFVPRSFDLVACVQNGICAFGAQPLGLLREALRVTRPGGCVLFSSYAERFWPHRLAWFEAQAAAGLIGPLDRGASRDGVIVCEDGFRAGRMTPEELDVLGTRLGAPSRIEEVDGSSLFLEILVGTGPEG